MRKFLSILMLACLLCGLVPAGAEGEPAQLYVKVGTDYHDSLSIPEGFSKTVAFYTKNEETNVYVPLSTGTPFTENTAVSLSGNVDNCTIEAKTMVESADITVNDESVTYAPVRVTVTASQLQIKKTTETTWGTSLDLMVGDSVGVELRLGAGEVFDSCTDSVTVPEGLTLAEGKLTANSAGTFELSYQGYTVTVRVTTSVIPIDKTELSYLQSNDDTAFRTFLMGKGYSGSGDCTLQLPAENLGNVTCNVQLPGDATLTIKGASGKTVAGLTIEADNICVDSVTFEGTSGVTMTGLTVKSAESCIITNCTFKNTSTSFALHLVQDESAPLLILDNNTFNGG